MSDFDLRSGVWVKTWPLPPRAFCESHDAFARRCAAEGYRAGFEACRTEVSAAPDERDRLAAELAAAREREAGLVAERDAYKRLAEAEARLAELSGVMADQTDRREGVSVEQMRQASKLEDELLSAKLAVAALSTPPAGEGEKRFNVADDISDERARELAAEVRKVSDAADAKAKRYVAAATEKPAPAAGTKEEQ